MNNTLIEGLGTTIVGMLTVFIILGLLCGVLYLLKYIDYFVNYLKDKGKPVTKEIKQPEIKEVKKENIDIIETDDSELVAVITAAISASTGTSSDKFQVKSITRASNWNSTARREQQRNII